MIHPREGLVSFTELFISLKGNGICNSCDGDVWQTLSANKEYEFGQLRESFELRTS